MKSVMIIRGEIILLFLFLLFLLIKSQMSVGHLTGRIEALEKFRKNILSMYENDLSIWDL